LPRPNDLIDLLSSQGWLYLKQAAILLDLTYHEAKQLVKNGDLVGVPVGKNTRIYTDEIARFRRYGNHPTKNSGLPDKPDSEALQIDEEYRRLQEEGESSPPSSISNPGDKQ
jgi:hypothetical protein